MGSNVVDLGEAVSSVFCDVVARDANKEGEDLVQENSINQALYDELKTFRLFHVGGEVAIDLSVANYVATTAASNEAPPSNRDEFLEFQLEDIPHIALEHSKSFGFELAGVRHYAHPIRCRLRLAFQDDTTDTIAMKVAITDDVVVKATLTDFQGTVDEVKKTIDANYYQIYFWNLGIPMGTGHVPLLGSVCRFHTVSIRKTTIQETLSLTSKAPALNSKQQDTLGQMRSLCLAYPEHTILKEATIRYQVNAETSQKYKEGRDIYRTVQGVGVDGLLFQLNLEHGKVGHMALTHREEEEAPFTWDMEPSQDEATMLLTSLAGFTTNIAKVSTFDDKTIVRAGWRIIPIGQGFVLKYQGRYAADALFCFDESSLPFIATREDQGNFYRRVDRTLQVDEENVVHNIAKLEGMTVKLVVFKIALAGIKDRLDLLGIEVNTDDADTDEDEEELRGAGEVNDEENNAVEEGQDTDE